MRILTSGLGILNEHFPSGPELIELEEPITVRELLEHLNGMGKDEFYNRVVKDERLSPYVIALHNGLSIDMKNGLDTELKDGDRLIFAVAVDGG